LFALLIVELFTGAADIDPALTAIEMILCVNKRLFPEILNFVNGQVRKFISSAWSLMSNDRLMFDDIFGQLEAVEFKIARVLDPNGVYR
jgi:hypothetical protein